MPKNLWVLLQPALEKYGNRPAWVCRKHTGRRVITYRQLHNAALTIADQLRQYGVQNGSSVGIIAPNGPEFTASVLAVWKIGANIAPLHTSNSGYEIAQQMRALSPQILLWHETNCDYQPAMPISMQSEDEAIARESRLPATAPSDTLAARMYTSGSIGDPKIVRLSHSNLISNMLAACNIGDFTEQDRFISLLPLSHAMGLLGNLLLPLYHGATIVSPEKISADQILATLSQENISVVIAVPRLFRNIMYGMEKKFNAVFGIMKLYRTLLKIAPLPICRLLNAPLRKKLGKHIKFWVSGGAHLDDHILRYFHALGLPLRQGYGLTETSPLVSMQDNFDAALESVGKPVERVRVKIHNPDQLGCGEILISGPNIMLGYESQQQTDEAVQDGWFKSGDIGRLDAQGRIFLTGRIKRLIVTEAGKNIYPEELEPLLERAPAIKEAAVFELNKRPVCVLAMQDGQSAAAEASVILAQFNRLVSPHNRITRFAVVDELPHTPLGKIALRELPQVFASNEVK